MPYAFSQFEEPRTVTRTNTVDTRFGGAALNNYLGGLHGTITRETTPAPRNPVAERAALMQYGAELDFTAKEYQEMRQRIDDLTKKKRNFDPEANAQWGKWVQASSAMEAMWKRKELTFDQYVGLLRQPYKDLIDAEFPWEMHLAPVKGDVQPDPSSNGMMMRRFTNDEKNPWERIGRNPDTDDEQFRAYLETQLFRGAGGWLFQYDSKRDKWDPLAQSQQQDPWEQSQKRIATVDAFRESFEKVHGRQPTTIEWKEQLGREIEGESYFKVTPDDIQQSVMEWGRHVQERVPPGLQQVLADPIQAAIASVTANGTLREPDQDGGKDKPPILGRPIVPPPQIRAAIEAMLSGQRQGVPGQQSMPPPQGPAIPVMPPGVGSLGPQMGIGGMPPSAATRPAVAPPPPPGPTQAIQQPPPGPSSQRDPNATWFPRQVPGQPPAAPPPPAPPVAQFQGNAQAVEAELDRLMATHGEFEKMPPVLQSYFLKLIKQRRLLSGQK